MSTYVLIHYRRT